MRKNTAGLFLFVVSLSAVSASAQSFEAGVHFAAAQWSEFDGSDLGVGGRVTWRPLPMIGIDADLTWYPSEFPESRASVSDQRFEGLFGVHAGPRLGAFRPFAKASAGFVRVAAAGQGVACIAIYPPPLSCLLAGGETLPAFEIGGGVAVNAGARTFVRADVADRILKYPGPTFRFGLREIAPEGFAGHAIRVTVGAGIRF